MMSAASHSTAMSGLIDAPPLKDTVSAFHHTGHPFVIEMLHVGDQILRVGRTKANPKKVPLLLFNGIGGNIEMLGPIAEWLSDRQVIIFDVPGVGHSPMPARPYRLGTVARMAAAVLDHYDHKRADVLGVSWGGAVAQEFAHSHPDRCRRLILCATAAGMFMVPAHPAVLKKMATPRRFISKSYSKKVSGDIYGGDFRLDPDLTSRLFKYVKWQSRLGYYLQLWAAMGWTSAHWLHRLKQPTLLMAGRDDPIIPLVNARLMKTLIPNSELRIFDCGHLFLMTRGDESTKAIRIFLDKP